MLIAAAGTPCLRRARIFCCRPPCEFEGGLVAFTGRPGKPAGETGFKGRPGSPEGETPEEIGRLGSPGEATGLPGKPPELPEFEGTATGRPGKPDGVEGRAIAGGEVGGENVGGAGGTPVGDKGIEVEGKDAGTGAMARGRGSSMRIP